MKEIIDKSRSNSNFKLYRPCGYPDVVGGHVLPEDVKEFYSMCGGMECYINSGGFPIRILPPSDVKLANKLLLGQTYTDDISSSWYVIADAEDGNFISIDFNPNRIGKCYESFEYTHAVSGNCPIISLSFTELLLNIINYKGDYFYWKNNTEFKIYGDAYSIS